MDEAIKEFKKKAGKYDGRTVELTFGYFRGADEKGVKVETRQLLFMREKGGAVHHAEARFEQESDKDLLIPFAKELAPFVQKLNRDSRIPVKLTVKSVDFDEGYRVIVKVKDVFLAQKKS